MILLPFFVEAPQFPPLAHRRERLVQSVLTLGATTLLFLFSAAPPLVFAVMPMFAWLAFRGTLREASLLLVGVSIVANTLTAFQLGPVWDLQGRYDLPPQLAGGFLQLFLLDCALLLLPLSVMVTQQRTSAARAASRSRTLERLISSATGTAVIATDEHGRITVFNPGAEVMLGCSAEAAVGRLPDGFFPDEELSRHAERLGTAPALRGDRGGLRRHRGQRHPVAVPSPRRRVPHPPDDRHRGPGGRGRRITGHLCIAEDVTEREAAHRALVTALDHERSAVDQLRELERVKARLRGHREPRAAHPDHQHGRLPRAPRGRRGRRADPAQLEPARARRAQRPPAAAAGRGPADALRHRGPADDHPPASPPTCATPSGRRTTRWRRCSPAAGSTSCSASPSSRSCTRSTRSRSSGWC